MKIKPIKMRWLTGGVNYSYLVSSTSIPTKSWLIDPAEVLEVVQALNDDELSSITHIVNTHHHYDHADGNLGIYQYLKHKTSNKNDIKFIVGSETPNVPVGDPDSYTIPKNDDVFHLGREITVRAIRTPCHTQDSVCYYVFDSSTKQHALFTGDTLFTAGCGRFFEGVGSEMDTALNSSLIKNIDDPSKTFVYPGHEYTKSNVGFVRKYIYRSVGENKAFDKLEEVTNANEVTTGLFTIADEMDYNPFMRLDDPLVRAAAGDKDGNKPRSAIMDSLRALKNKA